MAISLLFIVIPVVTTLLLQNTKGVKINQTALRHSVTFARYSILAFGVSLFAIFSKQILGLFRGVRPDWSHIVDFLQKNREISLFFGVSIGAVFYFSFIIFFTV
jgi:hypothetical protein